ncbi:MAG: hypothetical protein ACLPZF_26630, partial [Candidatus Acidiferrales bacterium]
HFSAALSGETLRRTNFGEKKPGHLVNLERPLSAGARLGGHFMMSMFSIYPIGHKFQLLSQFKVFMR